MGYILRLLIEDIFTSYAHIFLNCRSCFLQLIEGLHETRDRFWILFFILSNKNFSFRVRIIVGSIQSRQLTSVFIIFSIFCEIGIDWASTCPCGILYYLSHKNRSIQLISYPFSCRFYLLHNGLGTPTATEFLEKSTIDEKTGTSDTSFLGLNYVFYLSFLCRIRYSGP